jgi:hypothetical protein
MRPVALDQQARELLRAGAVEAALQLSLVCHGQGAAWAETALVEVALLLLQGKPHLNANVYCKPYPNADVSGLSMEKRCVLILQGRTVACRASACKRWSL